MKTITAAHAQYFYYEKQRSQNCLGVTTGPLSMDWWCQMGQK